jgi:hypothetical protein
MKFKCENKECTRKSMTKIEYIKRTIEGEKFGQVHCAGCHKPVFGHFVTCEQYHDIDGILKNDYV